MDTATRALDSLSGDGFVPHGHCYLWMPELLWTYVVPESIIVLRQSNASTATLCRYRIIACKQAEMPLKEQLDELHRWQEATEGQECRNMERERAAGRPRPVATQPQRRSERGRNTGIATMTP